MRGRGLCSVTGRRVAAEAYTCGVDTLSGGLDPQRI